MTSSSTSSVYKCPERACGKVCSSPTELNYHVVTTHPGCDPATALIRACADLMSRRGPTPGRVAYASTPATHPSLKPTSRPMFRDPAALDAVEAMLSMATANPTEAPEPERRFSVAPTARVAQRRELTNEERNDVATILEGIVVLNNQYAEMQQKALQLIGRLS